MEISITAARVLMDRETLQLSWFNSKSTLGLFVNVHTNAYPKKTTQDNAKHSISI